MSNYRTARQATERKIRSSWPSRGDCRGLHGRTRSEMKTPERKLVQGNWKI